MEACFEGLEAVCPGFAAVVDFAGAGRHALRGREVRWEVGAEVAVFRGGHNAVTGQQSVIPVNSIIGTKGVPNINPFNLKPGLTNSKLFAA
jgi:hypothetical protein